MSAFAIYAQGIRRVPSNARSLRVLTLTPFYPHGQNDAEGCFVAEVLPQTQQLGIENEVIAVTPFYRARVANAPGEIRCSWKRYFSVPGNSGLPVAGRFVTSALSGFVRKMHARRSFDLIHAHAALPCGIAAAKLSEELGIAFLVSVHGLDVFYQRQAGKMSGSWCRRLSAEVYRRARATISISQHVRERISETASDSRVIYNGVDTSRFFPGSEQSELIVLSVGNLIPSKGHACLLRAFAGISESVPECVLEIIGEGPERAPLVALAQNLGLASRVRFLGQQSRKAVAQAMQRCAVFVLPSRYEGLGCVYLEAMASGKPAIGCRGQGIEEIIAHGKNGFLVAPEAVGDLSETLRMLLQDRELRRRVGRNGCRTILSSHTLEHQATQLAELYRECLE